MEDDEHRGMNILAAADQEGEELQEAAQVDEPEDDEDERERNKPYEGDARAGNEQRGGKDFFPADSVDSRKEIFTAGASPKPDRLSHDVQAAVSDDTGNDWIELYAYPQADEEIGRKGR